MKGAAATGPEAEAPRRVSRSVLKAGEGLGGGGLDPREECRRRRRNDAREEIAEDRAERIAAAASNDGIELDLDHPANAFLAAAAGAVTE